MSFAFVHRLECLPCILLLNERHPDNDECPLSVTDSDRGVLLASLVIQPLDPPVDTAGNPSRGGAHTDVTQRTLDGVEVVRPGDHYADTNVRCPQAVLRGGLDHVGGFSPPCLTSGRSVRRKRATTSARHRHSVVRDRLSQQTPLGLIGSPNLLIVS